MIGISIAARNEWKAVLNSFNIKIEDCNVYPFGEYIQLNLYGEDVVLYRCGTRKTNCAAATQYMIDHFNLEKIVVAGTCGGIDNSYKNLDIFIPNKAVQYEWTIKKASSLVGSYFIVKFDLGELEGKVNTGTIGTSDKPVTTLKECSKLKENNITIADMESAVIAYICRANDVECIIIKGISDSPFDKKHQKNKSNNKQSNNFLVNTPVIMNNIIDNYLELAIKTSIKYKKDNP